MSLIWRADNPHPALVKLRDYLKSRRAGPLDANAWVPQWGQDPPFRRHRGHL
jgi:hypothetical protein